MNDYYTKTGNPAPNTQGRSGPIRDEFALVEAGFDAVNVEMDTKAPLASPAFTGTPTAPTPASVSDDSTKIATTAFVQDVLGASGSLLPPQATHAGKYLGTDGSVASWTALPVAWSERAIFQNNTGYTALPGQMSSAGYESDIDGFTTVYCNGNFIAIPATSSNVAYTSPDGLTWTARTLPSTTTWGDFAIVGTTIILGNNTSGARSTDGGVTWAAVTFPASFTELSGGPYFIGGLSGTTYYTSATGDTGSWTARTVPNPTSFSPTNGAYAAISTGNYLLFGQGSGGTGLALSSNAGVTWVADTGSAYRYAATDGTVVRMIEGNSTVNGAHSSDYGASFTSQSFAANNTMSAMCYGNKFVAAGTNSSTGYLTINYTTGASAWTSVAMGTTAGVFYAVAWSGSKYMAVGGTGAAKQCYTSTDGVTWAATAAVPAGATALTHVAYDTSTSKWVACDGTSLYWSSNDGTTWTTGASLASISWLGCLNNRLLALVGGAIYESTDGGATTGAVSGFSSISSVVWNANASKYFLRAGAAIVVSPDLVSRGIVPSAATTFISCATAQMKITNTEAIGFRSTDGITWNSFSLPVAYSITTLRTDTAAGTHAFVSGGNWYTTANGGSSWSTTTAYTSTDGNYAVPFAGGYIATRDAVSGLSIRIQFSNDGTNWTTFDTTGGGTELFASSSLYSISGTTLVARGVTFNNSTTAIYYA